MPIIWTIIFALVLLVITFVIFRVRDWLKKKRKQTRKEILTLFYLVWSALANQPFQVIPGGNRWLQKSAFRQFPSLGGYTLIEMKNNHYASAAYFRRVDFYFPDLLFEAIAVTQGDINGLCLSYINGILRGITLADGRRMAVGDIDIDIDIVRRGAAILSLFRRDDIHIQSRRQE